MKSINHNTLQSISGGSFWGAFCTTLVVGGIIGVAITAAPVTLVGATAIAAGTGAGGAATVAGGIAELTGVCDL